MYPIDVNKKVRNASKLSGSDKRVVFVQLFFLLSAVCFFILRLIFKNFLGITSFVPLIILQLVISITVGTIVFRFLIFDENEKIQEYKNSEHDSFAKYMYLKKDSHSEQIMENKKVHLFEYINGTATCTIAFKFGATDDYRASQTKRVLQEIFHVILLNGFEVRTVSEPESFEYSKEVKRHIDTINATKDKDLALHLKSITNNILVESRERSNVDMIYLTIRTLSNYQKYDLESTIRNIINIIYSNYTAFRSVEFLDLDEILEFYRGFYNIKAIDLAMMRAIDLSEDLDKEYEALVKLYSLHSEDNHVFVLDNSIADVVTVNERRIE